MHGKDKPHAPKPLYPMYPEEHKKAKPKKHENEEKRKGLCCQKRRQRVKSVIEGMRRGAVSRLEFWSVYGVPYLLVSLGVIMSILSLTLALMYKNDCPGLAILVPVLLCKLPLGVLDVAGLMLMTAEALHWNESYSWIRKITGKLSWRIVLGVIFTLFIFWGTILFVATNEEYSHGKPIKHDPTSPEYCHLVLYTCAQIYKYIMLFIIGFAVALFTFGGVTLLCLVCIVSRIKYE